MAANSGILYITYVEKQGPFLRIWGQMDRNLPVIIEKSLTQMTPQFESGLFMPTIDGIQCGLLCCAKYKDGAYYRARITNIALLHQNVVEVHFVDYGNKDIIPIVNLRTIGNFAPGLITIPPQAKDFILANVTHQGSSWDNDTVAIVCSEIRYMELTWVVVSHVGANTLIKLFKNGEDVALSFFNRGMVLSIASTAQHMILQSIGGNASSPQYHVGSPISPTAVATPMLPPTQVVAPAPPPAAQVVATPPPALLTYKAVSLEPGTENHVYVSYVSDGPCHFSVQLKKLEDTLARLMKELNRMNLQPLEDDPIPGTVCVARCIEDEHICRAVVTSMVDGQYKVFYVDFGNSEVVPLDNLYQIPFKYVIPKVMAMRYALAGLERSSVTLEMKCAFKEFVSDKLLRMRALPPPTRSALPLCSLWDDKNINVLDVLRQAALLAYPEAVQLTRGFSQEIRVSYVHSCSHFYVQIKSKDEELRKVMEELQSKCPYTNQLSPSEAKVGLPCCALFDADGQWYRAQILSKESDTIKVRYVDYGNEELVVVTNLRMPPAEQLTALRPQALECCLNGYQNMADDLERDNILEELILEKEFVMKVVEMQGNRALVELYDSSRYNVGSLLLERLATAKSQVSPLLIQDSHHIEQRKRKSPVQQRLDRKPMRNEQNDKGWNNEDNERNNRQDSWRQGRPPRKDYGEERNGGDNFERRGKRDGFKNDNWGGNRDDGFKKESWGEGSEDGGKKESWGGGGRGDGFKKESWGGGREDGARKESWGGGGGKGDSFKKEGWGGGREDSTKKDSWGGGGRDNFKKDSWGGGGDSQWKRNGNQREGSEKSFSDGGSEKNWRRSPRGNNFNEDRRPKRKFDSGGKSGSSWNSTNHDGGFNNDKNFANVTDPAPSSAVFVYPDLVSRCEKVLISWFHDPAHFFCQLQEFQDEFRTMMSDIQNLYCNIKPSSSSVGAPVIALYPDDGVMYRACVLEVVGMQYRVQYVDFGNVSTTDKIWPIENKFMRLAAQAICCNLNGIAPLADKWGNPDTFSAYFDKEFFMCTFISSENQNYSVELTYDNQSVSELLVSAGLARFDVAMLVNNEMQEHFDPSVLLGQQMRIMLGEVQSLDTFYVQLQNGIQIFCTMHNLASATQTYEDTLKQCVGSILIMYVDNVLEEKTEITLYDNTTGIKLKIIEPDEGAYDTIEMLCPLPVFYSTISGWISYLTPDGEKFRVFIQPPEYADTLAQLLEDLFNVHDASEETALQAEVGLIYAVHSSDGNWYRGQATGVDDQTVTVTFVDYGNSESVAPTQLRELTPDFKQQHMLALELVASGVDETFIEHEVTANAWYGENGWEAEIQKIDQSVPQTQTDAVLEEYTTEADKEIPSEQPAVQTSEENAVLEESEPQIKQSNQIGVSVILSHVDSPGEFYVQLSEDVEAINALQETLQEQVSSFPDLESPAAGVLCAAPYSVDQQWYRAQVLDADVDITTVRFVDFGNTDVLTNTTTHVKTLPPDLLSLEQHARRCSLIVKAVDTEWSSQAYEKFEALTAVENLSAEIVHQDEKTTYIELFANGQNVAKIFLQEGLAVKLQLETESSCSGYVSHLNSPSEFWVQLENSVADLEWIAEQLSQAENFPELEDLTPGSLCAALFPDDEMWYRARILSNTVAGLEVLFIDYGNSCTCTGLRQLPEDLIMLPALAQKCSLQKPPGLLQWSSQATEEFRTISADGATIFNIDKLSTGETSIVKLLLDEADIATQLMAKTEDAFISYFESISSFWLQKTENTPKLNIITETLLKASEWPKYEPKEDSEIVAALCPEDGQWYRAHILNENNSDYEVLFIDFGNTSTTSDIRTVMCDIEKESPLAIKYKLEPLPGFRWNEESSKKLAEISNNGATVFQVEFAMGDAVRLYLNGNDIRSDLDSTCISSAQSTPKRISVLKTDTALPQGILNFIDTDSELLVLNGNKTEETAELYKTDGNQKHEQDDEVEYVGTTDDKFETALSTNEQKSSEDVTEFVEIVSEGPEDMKLPTNEIKESEEHEVFEDANESAESTIKESTVGKIAVLDDKMDMQFTSNEIMDSEEPATSKHITETVKLAAEESTLQENQMVETSLDKKVENVASSLETTSESSPAKLEVSGGISPNKLESETSPNKLEITSETSPDKLEITGDASPEKLEIRSEASAAKLEVSGGTSPNKLESETSPNKLEITSETSPIKLEITGDASPEKLEITSESSPAKLEVTGGNSPNKLESETSPNKLEITGDASPEKLEIRSEASSNELDTTSGSSTNTLEATAEPSEENILDIGSANPCVEENLAAVTDKVQKHDDELNEQNSQNIQQTSIEQVRSDSSIYIPQRRPSTPYEEKIVPGAVSRGDLTQVLTDDNEEIIDLEKIVPASNETGENKNEQCAQVVNVSPAKSKNEEPPKEILPNTSFCKIDVGERIVPGAISRGETPEPPHSENASDKIVSNAVNGDEVKDNLLS